MTTSNDYEYVVDSLESAIALHAQKTVELLDEAAIAADDKDFQKCQRLMAKAQKLTEYANMLYIMYDHFAEEGEMATLNAEIEEALEAC
jgi:hypothetical protein